VNSSEPIDKGVIIFPFLISRHYSGLIDWTDKDDPLRRQVEPDPLENSKASHEKYDPLQENSATQLPGLIHKYSGRILLLLTSRCPIHCRFCFRRDKGIEYDESQMTLSRSDFANIIEYIESHNEIHEVILSGGDPLMIDRDYLNEILERLDSIQHLMMIRIHSRCPVASPDIELLTKDIQSNLRCCLRIVIHINHPGELSSETVDLISKYRKMRIPVLSQTVLLAGVNDKVETLFQLFLRLSGAGVKPYYLHLMDPAPGTSHFYVSSEIGKQLLDEVSRLLPGHAIPKLVRDVPGEASKIII